MKRTAIAITLGALLLALARCAGPDSKEQRGGDTRVSAATVPTAVNFSPEEISLILQHSPLGDPPVDPTNRFASDPRAVRLGHSLYFDTRLSANGQVSCATCHDPQKGFADGKPLAEGMGTGTRHTPTVWNAVYNRWFFWDGRADSLWAQAVQPLERSLEHGFNRLALAHLIRGDAEYRQAYESIFGPLPPLDEASRFPPQARPVPDAPDDPLHVTWSNMTEDDRNAVTRVLVNVAKSIAAYESKIVSRRSKFDVFVEGLREGDETKVAALSESAQRGLRTFIGVGQCRVCHSGPNFTDGEFHSVRVPPRPGGDAADAGRFVGAQRVVSDEMNAAGEFSDDRSEAARRKIDFLANGQENWGRFKTPTLRNIALTAPYMHQGQFSSLAEVITHYSTFDNALPVGHHDETILKPLFLTEWAQNDLRSFLMALTDTQIDPALLRPPESPLVDAGLTDVPAMESRASRR